MTSKLVLGVGAIVLAAAGLALLFAPQETIAFGFGSAAGIAPIVFQLMGSSYLGLAALDWLARGSTIGGIYGRPITFANVIQFGVGGLSLLRHQMSPARTSGAWVVTGVWVILALAFLKLLFGRPQQRESR